MKTIAYEECSSFDVCSCNKCPLHEDYSKLRDEPEDKAIKGWRPCRSNKITRMKIGKKYSLKNQGLTLKELDSQKKSKLMSALIV